MGNIIGVIIGIISRLYAEIITLYHILLSPIKGATHKDRLESFYKTQASFYDNYRKKLLHGRELFLDTLQPNGGVWVDMGGGTGFNVEYMAKIGKLSKFSRVYIVDLSPSLLEVARKRARDNGWNNVMCIEGDATSWQPTEQVDIVTFSYSLTMIPDWINAIENANKFLKIGGTIGTVDFYVSRKYPLTGLKFHPWYQRIFWTIFFGLDNVNLSSDHLCYLCTHYKQQQVIEREGSVPYIPLFKVPHYIYIGQKDK